MKYRQIKEFLALCPSEVVDIVLINVRMPIIVGTLTFISRINSCSAELFITSRPNLSHTGNHIKLNI